MAYSNMTIDEMKAEMKVLVVDDNPQVLEPLLRQCQYLHVICITRPATAVNMLVEKKDKIDMAIINVDMTGLDGFALLQYVDYQLNIPAIMLSSNGHNDHIRKGISHGACDALIKPVRAQELDKIWQHVYRRNKLNSDKRKINEKSEGDCEALEEQLESAQISSDHNNKSDNKRKENEGEVSSANTKKTRLVWTRELHAKFVEVVTTLGIDNAVPKKILEMMNNKSLTRENVASHLQKYRLSSRTFKDDEANNPSDHDNIYNFEPQWYQHHELVRTVDPINTDHTFIQENQEFAIWSPNAYSNFSSVNHEGWPRAAQPIIHRHHHQATSSDDNTPTFHHPINQPFSHGNTFGVPRHHQQADDQFFQGFHFHANDQGFDHVARRDDDVQP